MAPRIRARRAARAVPPPSSPPAPGASAAGAGSAPAAPRGLGSSAYFLGEVLRPLAWLGAQLLLILQPTLSLLGGGPTVARLVQTLEHLDSPPGDSPQEAA